MRGSKPLLGVQRKVAHHQFASSIHGQSMLPALPAALQLGKDRAGGLLAAFCCPTPPDPAWELLYGEDAAQLLL